MLIVRGYEILIFRLGSSVNIKAIGSLEVTSLSFFGSPKGDAVSYSQLAVSVWIDVCQNDEFGLISLFVPTSASWVIVKWRDITLGKESVFVPLIRVASVITITQLFRILRFVAGENTKNSWFKPNIIFLLLQIGIRKVYCVFRPYENWCSACNKICNFLFCQSSKFFIRWAFYLLSLGSCCFAPYMLQNLFVNFSFIIFLRP